MRFWTVRHAAGIGVAAGFAAGLLWPVFATWPVTRPAFIAALALMAFCGLSLLVLGLFDLATRRRGISVRPARIFDLVLGIALAVPSLLTLDALLGSGDLRL